MWWIQPLEIAGPNGERTGRWRLTAKSDEGGGGPYGDDSHDHASAEEAQQCEACDEYCSRWSGMPSKKARREAEEAHERAEYERLKAKYAPARPEAYATEEEGEAYMDGYYDGEAAAKTANDQIQGRP